MYDTAVLPARPRAPRDKAKVETAVLIIERWLLGRLRHRRFYSLAELNTAIGELLRRHFQIMRPGYAPHVGGAAARVGELLCLPIVLPRSSRAGPEKGALGPLS